MTPSHTTFKIKLAKDDAQQRTAFTLAQQRNDGDDAGDDGIHRTQDAKNAPHVPS
ncbi:hypothetical protein D2E23_0986 [Bifidobacterium callimiconis]|uniref:Uncharacterized protein n=1 Tax=Bifidobacterium callimiconis TaxID=2306973 RepID=A0A430FEE6_9BIFI|nr:hypothetical protein D2E23_0986 [Bifidobacterium callimiconis]